MNLYRIRRAFNLFESLCWAVTPRDNTIALQVHTIRTSLQSHVIKLGHDGKVIPKPYS